MRLVQLLEADVLGVLMEALPAEVEVVLPDQAVPASINFRPTLSFFLPSLSILFHIFPFSLSSPIAASFTLPRAGSKLPWSGIPDVVMTHFNSTDHSQQRSLRFPLSAAMSNKGIFYSLINSTQLDPISMVCSCAYVARHLLSLLCALP